MNRFLKITRCLAATGVLLLVFSFFAKAEVQTAAGLLPERVVLNITENPHDSQAVTWRTRQKGTAPAAQIVLLSDLLKLETGVRIFNAETCRVDTGDTGPAYHHAVVFESLSADTDYAFRVGDDPVWSEWCRFKTASDGPAPFTMVFFGDIQVQVHALGSQLFRTAALAVPDAAFWLFAGDMVDNGPDDREWAEFFTAVSWMARTFPLVPVPGNHEYPDPRIIPKEERRITPLWRPHFTLPDNGPPGLEETVYYFAYQGVLFIVLNGNEQIETQAAWLEAILSQNIPDWIIVSIHQPVYPISMRRHSTTFQEVFVPVFDRFGVDLVLQGHDHGYARTVALKNNQPVPENEPGTVYIISNSGPKFYPVSDRYDHLMARTGSEEMLFHTIRVEGDALHFTAFDITGRLVDTAVLQKNHP
jgi:acid phosphatase type 7